MFRRCLTVTASLLFLVVLSVHAATFDKPILMEKSKLPKLSRVLKKSNAKGIVLVKVAVDPLGNTFGIDLVRSTGIQALDEFITDWIAEWKFLPKLKNNETVAGFTIISMRYDLSENTFETPPVNKLTMTLPEPFQKIWLSESEKSQSMDTHEGSDQVFPLVPLMITNIPPEVQQKNVSVNTTLCFLVGSEGHVLSINRPEFIDNDVVWRWLTTELKKTVWSTISDKYPVKIEIPFLLETSLCKVEFGEPRMAGVTE
ncbi:energy transducer TonB [bacterium]|nr:energy transducer TonB [bacterium]